MQGTTANYNPYADTREITVQASFELIDVDAAEVAAAAASEQAVISKLLQTYDKITLMTEKVATLEKDYWKLDGTFGILDPESTSQVGWWSKQISDADGYFTTNPTITYTFETSQSSKGFTVVFDNKANEYCTEFNITTYGASENVISSVAVVNNDKNTVIVDMSSENYYKVVIEFIKTNNPYRRARVCEFVFGFLQIFEKNDIAGVEVLYETNVYMNTFPAAELTLKINNADKKYNIINPTGIYKFLQTGQGINVSLGINGETINMGRFYFNSAKTQENSLTAEITAYDRALMLDNIPCNIGTDGTWTVEAAVAAVIANSGLPIATNIPEEVKSTIINKCIPYGSTTREALRLIAQAACCICYFSREDVLNFVKPAIELPVDVIDADCMSGWAEAEDTGLINSVIVTSNNEYIEGEENVTTYIAQDIGDNEREVTLEVSNALARSADVADWILSMAKKRITLTVQERGNIARELIDTVKIYDYFNENNNCITISEDFVYNGSLKGELKAVTSV